MLIDLRGSLWLIDFASTGPDKNPFTDGAKMVAALLFEYFPVPLSLQEVRTASAQKLKDAFGINSCARWPRTFLEPSSNLPQTFLGKLL